MNKYEFLYKLDKALGGFSPKEKTEIVHYYDELIQDALDSGENELAFIDRLGSVETIVRTIKKDGGFVTNVKQKQNFQLRKVFDLTVRILGYGLFAIVVITIGSIAFSFVVSGISIIVVSIGRYLVSYGTALTSATLMMYGGNLLLGAGLTLAGFLGFKWLIKTARGLSEKILEFVDKIVKRIGENK